MLAIPFTLLWIVGVVNAMNLIDGLDGLAGVVALFAVLTTFIVAVNQPNPLMMLFTAALAGAILGFLFYNLNPATIFMGDTGSMFPGFILAAASIKSGQKSSTAVAILTPIVALGLPILDTLLAMARRAVRGRPLFSADKEHIHHRLMSLGMSHRQAAFALYAVCLALNVVALVLVFSNRAAAASLLVALTIVGFFAMRRLGTSSSRRRISCRIRGDEIGSCGRLFGMGPTDFARRRRIAMCGTSSRASRRRSAPLP